MGYNKLKQKVATALIMVMSMSATLSVTAATTTGIQTKIYNAATRASSPSDTEKPGDTTSSPSDTDKPGTDEPGTATPSDAEKNAVEIPAENITASVDLGTVKAEGLEEGQEMTITDVKDEDKKDDSALKSVLQNFFSGFRFTQIKFFGINIDVSNYKGKKVTIYLDAPEELAIESENDEIIGIHFDKGTPKKFDVGIRKNGNKFRMNFSTSSFSPFYFVKIEGKETINTPGGNTSGGSSGGGRSSSATREATMNGKWVVGDNGWKFLKDNGEYATNTWGYIKGQWYFFDAQGNMVTGWYFINDQWYYMNPAEGSLQGAMLTGWVQDPNYNGWFYLNASGAMLSGWNQIGGKWYYMNPISDGTKGIMAANTYIDSYYVGADGVWIQ